MEGTRGLCGACILITGGGVHNVLSWPVTRMTRPAGLQDVYDVVGLNAASKTEKREDELRMVLWTTTIPSNPPGLIATY